MKIAVGVESVTSSLRQFFAVQYTARMSFGSRARDQRPGFQAIEESGYRPNLLARNPATKRTQTLGLVVTNTLYHGVYFSELLFNAARMTEEKGGS